jgi:hypothetical protein
MKTITFYLSSLLLLPALAQAGETAQAYSFGPELFVQAGEAASVAVYDVLGTQVGAITWVDGGTGASFTVNATNSLIGLLERERLGTIPVTQLSNGNYLAVGPIWQTPIPTQKT